MYSLTKMNRRRAGFTLIEIMVVVIVLGILAAIIIPNFAGKTDEARVVKAKTDLSDLTAVLEAFRLDLRRYPTEEEGLKVLRVAPKGDDGKLWKGPYLTRAMPKDPWGNAYKYYCPAPTSSDPYGIECLGSDGKPGGTGLAADIQSWSSDEKKQR